MEINVSPFGVAFIYLQGDQEVTDSGFNKHTEPLSYDDLAMLRPCMTHISLQTIKVVPEGYHRYFFGVKVKTVKLMV